MMSTVERNGGSQPSGIVLALAAAVVLTPGVAAQDDNPRLRWEHFYMQRAYPFTVIPPGAVEAARRDLMAAWPNPFAAAPAVSAAPWQQLGPEQIPSNLPSVGRLTAIAVDPSDPNTIYVGGAQGGVWKTVNGGAAWVPLTDGECSLAMGSIAIDPVNPDIVYAGTGEQHFSGDSYYGCGVLRSEDAGGTWVQLGAAEFQTDSGRAMIARVVLDPTTAGTAATTTVLVASDFGVYRSTDGGATWTRVVDGTTTDLVMDPSNSQVLYAGIWGNGISKSTDGGVSWSAANVGFPSTNVGRINLAIAPFTPAVLYASVHNSSSNQLLGLYKTGNGAGSWAQVNNNGVADCSSQCWYDMTLAVHPRNTNLVYFGGVYLFRSVDGGSNFDFVGGQIHVDQHILAFDPSDADRLYVGNDGGVYRTADATAVGTPSWESLNTNLSITQFYPGISFRPTDPNFAMGGTQDNGTLRYRGFPVWDQIYGADGGYTAIDPSDPSTFYFETQWTTGSSFSGPRRSDAVGTPKVNGINRGDRALFIPPLVMDPSDPATLYFGTFRVYKTTNRADSWTAISGDLTAGRAISAIAVAPSNPDVVYVGTSDGRVQRTTNGGASWSDITGSIPQRFVRDIAVDPVDEDRAYATVSGFHTGHVFQTTDGATWQDVSGNLPDLPVNAVLIEPGNSQNIYLGTDLGAFVSTSGGTTWSPFNDGLPLVAVFDLTMNPSNGLMLAGTHGRGMFARTIALSLALAVTPESRIDSVAAGSSLPSSDSASVLFVGPGATTQSWSAVHGGGTWLTITNGSGTGDGVVRWTRDPAGLALGTYVDTITVTADGTPLSPAEVVDTLVIGEPLAMALSGSSRNDTTVAGSTRPVVDSVAVTVTGVGAGQTRWTATHGGGGWISFLRFLGDGDGTVLWQRNASQLAAGIYVDTITVSAEGTGVTPQSVVDTLVVASPIALRDAADEFFVGGVLSPLQVAFLDAIGNDDGTYNLGDVLAWVDWCNGTSAGGCVTDAASQQLADALRGATRTTPATPVTDTGRRQ